MAGQALGSLEQQQSEGVCNTLLVPKSFMPEIFKVWYGKLLVGSGRRGEEEGECCQAGWNALWLYTINWNKTNKGETYSRRQLGVEQVCWLRVCVSKCVVWLFAGTQYW